jgi:YidC/Oxa1 family membrane protein insertase
MDSQKRLLVALGLSFLLTMVYVTFFVKPPVDASPDAGAVAVLADAGFVAVAAPVPVLSAPVDADGGVAVVAPPVEVPPLVKVVRERKAAHYTFSSEGAALVRAQLQGHKMREQPKLTLAQGLGTLVGKKVPAPPQMDLGVPVAGWAAPLSVSIEGPQPLPANTFYKVTDLANGGVEFVGVAGPWQVKKTLEWRDDFQLNLTVEVKNLSAAPAAGELALHVSRGIDPTNEEKGSFFGGIGNQSRTACLVGEAFEHIIPADEVKPPSEFKGPVHFYAIDQQYFLSAVFPLDAPRDGRCVLTATPTGRQAVGYFPVSLAPGQAVTQVYGVFIGPKDVDDLAKVSASSQAGGGYRAGLEKTVDFGIWAVIVKVLLVVLKFFHGLTGNWGVAIILLTVLVKLVLLPLTHRSMVAAEAMKKLQPQMEVIRKKFADDKERQNMEMMKLYQEAKVNPLGGCLPLLFQLPIWAALFTTLRTSYDLYAEPFLNPMWADLTYKDPTYILPLVLGITMIATQKLQPQMMDATQAKVMTYGMPVFFTAIMLNYPSGLSLYIFTNNVLSIAQQYALRRYLERTGKAAPRLVAGKDKQDKKA